MALIKSTISIPFGQGLETKQDSKTVMPGKLLQLQNGELDQIGSITKRYGYDVLNQTAFLSGGATTTVRTGSALATFKDELILMDGKNLYSRNVSSGSWLWRGTVVPNTVDTFLLEADETTAGEKDGYGVEYANGLTVYAWKTDNAIYAIVKDQQTGATVRGPDQLVNASGNRQPKLVKIGDRICVVWDGQTTGELKIRYLDSLAPMAGWSASANLLTDLSGTAAAAAYDVVRWDDTKAMLVYASGSGARIRHFTHLTASTTQNRAWGTAAETPDILSVAKLADGRWKVLYWCSGSSTGIKEIAFNDDATLTVSHTSATLLANTGFMTGVCGLGIAPESNGYRAFVEFAAPHDELSYKQFVYTFQSSSAGPLVGASTLARGIGLASKPFRWNDDVYVNVLQETTLQCTYYTMNASGTIIARILANEAGTVSDGGGGLVTGRMSNVVETSTGSFTWMGLKQVAIPPQEPSVAGIAVYTGQVGIQQTFGVRPRAVEFADGLHIAAGGMMYHYDGQYVQENGFHVFPEDLSTSGTLTGGNLEDGVYQVCVVYAWYDKQGRLWESAPSIPESETISGGSGNAKITVTYPFLWLTDKQGVDVRFYRTLANGNIFYYDAEISNDLGLIVGIDRSTAALGTEVTPDDIAENAQLYTGDGTVENVGVPTPSSLTVKGERLFAYAGENKIWFSQKEIEGAGVGFSDLFVKKADATGGESVVLDEMDGSIIILKNKNIQRFAGDGPTVNGANDQFTDVTSISTDVGAKPGSPSVGTDKGVYFIANKGVCLLNRAGAVDFIGAAVDAYRTGTFTSAVLVPDKQQVRIGQTSGSALVHDYFLNQWSTFTGHDSVDATVWQNKYVFLRSNGEVRVQNTASFTESGSFIPLVAETAWIKFKDVQDFGRIWKVGVLGEHRSPCQVTVKVSYDYESAVSETVTYNASGSYGEPMEFFFKPARQKCEAMKLRIEDGSLSGSGEGVALTAISLEVGLKKGLNKGSQSKVV